MEYIKKKLSMRNVKEKVLSFFFTFSFYDFFCVV